MDCTVCALKVASYCIYSSFISAGFFMLMTAIEYTGYAFVVCIANMLTVTLCRSTFGVAASSVASMLAGGALYSRDIGAVITMCKAAVFIGSTFAGNLFVSLGIAAATITAMLAGRALYSCNIVTAISMLMNTVGYSNITVVAMFMVAHHTHYGFNIAAVYML